MFLSPTERLCKPSILWNPGPGSGFALPPEILDLHRRVPVPRPVFGFLPRLDSTGRAVLDAAHALLAVVKPDRPTGLEPDILHGADLQANAAGSTTVIDGKLPVGVADPGDEPGMHQAVDEEGDE